MRPEPAPSAPRRSVQPDAHARILRARTALLIDEPFFGQLALKLIPVRDTACRDMWTDALQLGYNPSYVDKLADVELKGLIAHVVLHIAAGHPWRMESRNAARWNKAADLAINHELLQAGFRLPEGSLRDSRYKGKSAENIYQALTTTDEDEHQPEPHETPKTPELPETPDGAESHGDSGEGSGTPDDEGNDDGGSNEGGAPSASEVRAPGEVRQAAGESASETDWQISVSSAMKAQGSLAAGLQRLVKGFLKPRADWREVLRDFVERASSPDDYVWSRPNPRYQYMGLYLPVLEGQETPAIVAVRDTSGSISDRNIALFNAELQDILDSVRPKALHLLDVDAAVHRAVSLEPDATWSGDGESAIPADALGGGGTSFVPAFDWVHNNGEHIACLVYLTDLMGVFPQQAPDYPVLWVVPEEMDDGKQPPFGELVILRKL